MEETERVGDTQTEIGSAVHDQLLNQESSHAHKTLNEFASPHPTFAAKLQRRPARGRRRLAGSTFLQMSHYCCGRVLWELCHHNVEGLHCSRHLAPDDLVRPVRVHELLGCGVERGGKEKRNERHGGVKKRACSWNGRGYACKM